VNNKIGSFKFINVQILPESEESDGDEVYEKYGEEVSVGEEQGSQSPGSSEYPGSYLYSATNTNVRRRNKR
jgi:hypothetical protein